MGIDSAIVELGLRYLFSMILFMLNSHRVEAENNQTEVCKCIYSGYQASKMSFCEESVN